MKAKLARYRAQLLEPAGVRDSSLLVALWTVILVAAYFTYRLYQGKKGAGEGFEVLKSGDARVALIGCVRRCIWGLHIVREAKSPNLLAFTDFLPSENLLF
jgi:hypothetical protein